MSATLTTARAIGRAPRAAVKSSFVKSVVIGATSAKYNELKDNEALTRVEQSLVDSGFDPEDARAIAYEGA